MTRTLILFIFFIAVQLVPVAGYSSSPISPEVRREADENLAFTKVLAKPTAYHGTVVVWGGVIMKVVVLPDRTDIYLWETPLDVTGKPKGREYTEGEYIARTSEKLDPAQYEQGRKVTVAGEVVGGELGQYLGEPYVYPVVKTREIHLWEKEAPAVKWDWGRVPYYSPGQFSPDEQRQRQIR